MSDVSGMDALIRDLGTAAPKVVLGIPPVMRKAGLNVKNEWRDNLAASDSFKGQAGSVTFDTKATREGFEVEIGPDKDRYPGISGPAKSPPSAALTNIAHFGGARGGGGTVPDPMSAALTEEPKMIGALNALMRDIL